MKTYTSLFALGLLMTLVACGQGPSFGDKSERTSDDATGAEIDDMGGKSSPTGDGEVALPGEGAADGETAGDEEGDDGEGTPTLPPEIPAADDKDIDALHKCLSKWKGHPFKGTVDNYYRIAASISIGGMGNAIKDTERTDEPFLILVDAAVNVGGAPTYELMNPNGYYCMKVNVNVLTSLNINLHCNARLADSKVSVNVGSTQNDSTSAVGVHVLSNVQVNSVRPEGDSCIR